MIACREAKPEEIPYIARLTTRSFGNDPFFDFVFRGRFRQSKAYFAYLKKLHRIHIRANRQHHQYFVGIRNGKIVSTALLQNPLGKRVSVLDYIRAGALLSSTPPFTAGQTLIFYPAESHTAG